VKPNANLIVGRGGVGGGVIKKKKKIDHTLDNRLCLSPIFSLIITPPPPLLGSWVPIFVINQER